MLDEDERLLWLMLTFIADTSRLTSRAIIWLSCVCVPLYKLVFAASAKDWWRTARKHFLPCPAVHIQVKLFFFMKPSSLSGSHHSLRSSPLCSSSQSHTGHIKASQLLPQPPPRTESAARLQLTFLRCHKFLLTKKRESTVFQILLQKWGKCLMLKKKSWTMLLMASDYTEGLHITNAPFGNYYMNTYVSKIQCQFLEWFWGGGGGLLTETSAFSVLSSLSFHGFIHNSLSLLKCLFLSLFPDEMSRSISYWRLNDWVGLLFACHSPSLATHSDFCRDEIWFILWGCVTLCTEMKQRCWLCVAWMKLLSVDSSLVFLCVTSSELMPSTHCLYVLALVKKLLLAGELVYCDTTATS